MFLKHFDFRYHSNHNFHASAKNDVHNQHIATCSHTKFHQARLNSCFFNYLGIQNSVDRLLDRGRANL